MLPRRDILTMVYWPWWMGRDGSVTTPSDAADSSMGLMATVNMIAIALPSGTVARLMRDYRRQRKADMKPVFDMGRFPEPGARSMPPYGRAPSGRKPSYPP
ncbi:MAG: alanine:cation symporter family protein [Burkholderiaceae bacterium]